jgi:hypothetical protein
LWSANREIGVPEFPVLTSRPADNVHPNGQFSSQVFEGTAFLNRNVFGSKKKERDRGHKEK